MAHRLAPEAEADLDAIWYYVATESGSSEVADRQVRSITDRFLLLADFPQMGRRRDEDLGSGLRTFVADAYLILYCIEGEDVLILHVTHGRRDIEGMFGG